MLLYALTKHQRGTTDRGSERYRRPLIILYYHTNPSLNPHCSNGRDSSCIIADLIVVILYSRNGRLCPRPWRVLGATATLRGEQ